MDGDILFHAAVGLFYAVGWYTFPFFGNGNYEIHVTKLLFRHKSRPNVYLSYSINDSGYRTRSLRHNGKNKKITEHQIVFYSVFPELYALKVEKGYQIDHIEPNSKLNNRIENLQIISASENTKKARDDNVGTHMTAAKKRVFMYRTFTDLMANRDAAFVFSSVGEAEAAIDKSRSITDASFCGLQVTYQNEKYYVKIEKHSSNPFELWVCSDTLNKYTKGKAMISNQGRTGNLRTGTATLGVAKKAYRKSGYRNLHMHKLQWYGFYDEEVPVGKEICHKDGVIGMDSEGCKPNLIGLLRLDSHDKNMKEMHANYHEQRKLDSKNFTMFHLDDEDEKQIIKRRRVR